MTSEGNNSIASRLLRAVLAKSFIEILFVCVIVAFAAFSNFSPLLRGTIDEVNQTRISGWVYDPLSPDESIDVQLFIDSRFIASKPANEIRIDLVEAGATTKPNHGFTFTFDSLNLSEGIHTVQIYALRKAAGANKALIPISKTPQTFKVKREDTKQ